VRGRWEAVTFARAAWRHRLGLLTLAWLAIRRRRFWEWLREDVLVLLAIDQ
jgi:hypothetical protein